MKVWLPAKLASQLHLQLVVLGIKTWTDADPNFSCSWKWISTSSDQAIHEAGSSWGNASKITISNRTSDDFSMRDSWGNPTFHRKNGISMDFGIHDLQDQAIKSMSGPSHREGRVNSSDVALEQMALGQCGTRRFGLRQQWSLQLLPQLAECWLKHKSYHDNPRSKKSI